MAKEMGQAQNVLERTSLVKLIQCQNVFVNRNSGHKNDKLSSQGHELGSIKPCCDAASRFDGELARVGGMGEDPLGRPRPPSHRERRKCTEAKVRGTGRCPHLVFLVLLQRHLRASGRDTVVGSPDQPRIWLKGSRGRAMEVEVGQWQQDRQQLSSSTHAEKKPV